MKVSSSRGLLETPPALNSKAKASSSSNTTQEPDRSFAALLREKAATAASSITGTSSIPGQRIVTTQNSSAVTGTTTPSAGSGIMNTSKVGFNALVGCGPSVPQVQSAPAVQHNYVADPVDDAYWSAQPDAVQKLRDIEDPSQRMATAATLASQGYQIDVPIMGWGWDAGKTMALRASSGYTWVPSALGTPVTAAPGITGPGITPYDPNHPPAGSIKVTV